MKKIAFIIGGICIASLVAGSALAGTGNGIDENGKRFTLNIIAYDKDHCPAGEFDDSNRHMIAVEADFGEFHCDINKGPTNPTDPCYCDPSNPIFHPDCPLADQITSNQAGTNKTFADITKTNTILLTPGEDFQVLDGNACGTKGGAALQLPADVAFCSNGDQTNCPVDDPEFQNYKVYVRLVGKLKTAIGVTSCAEEAYEDLNGNTTIDVLCSTESVIKVRTKGPRFDDVTKELLTLCLDTDTTPGCDTRVGLFDPRLVNYFWQWNTIGKAHAQLVFVALPD